MAAQFLGVLLYSPLQFFAFFGTLPLVLVTKVTSVFSSVIVGFLLAIYLVTSPSLVMASDAVAPTPTPVVEDAESAVIISAEELAAARQKYLDNVALYRDSEDKFLLAREQYYNLNTLSALEEAKRRGKDVLRARAEVLITYYSYLKLVLQSTKGMEVQDKQAVEEGLTTWISELEAYREEVAPAESREEINEKLIVLNELSEELYNIGYTTLALIKIGEIRTALDNTLILRGQVATAVESSKIAAASRELKARGLEEVDRLSQRAGNNLYKLQEDFRRNAASITYNEQSYRRFQTEAEYSYLQLRQAVSFLEEVMKDL